ncbi:hypothetical protein DAPPUDRAFT_324110 [Daphnia pulex]|uniref:Peptidase M1 membrane alanine aminopeptidase domain-containing protein n=1 Tax=Daphnia pulex TaxID=6669 RepID=E9H0Q5_DAPPU|nr:hypothetical protein DAPPUDRAFT_324110 [Daphnia pulex]|eukprot:EFX74708.1 hypothetical protein DAPPUDRAFT_324110 [Daphnia pulex]
MPQVVEVRSPRGELLSNLDAVVVKYQQQIQSDLVFCRVTCYITQLISASFKSEIHEIFDRISYGKGATIIQMLAAFLGEKTFRQGLTNYLKSRQYGNAVQDELWDALTKPRTKQAKVDKVPLPTDVKQIMDTWTLKMGFPVVTVTREYEKNSVSSAR